MTLTIVARAKVNLCLHVTGLRQDGYHLLDSIVGFADLGDVLTFIPAESLTLTIGGPFADGLSGQDENLILRAARCFDSATGAAIHLQKNLPIASGIGGGSADAAATLRALSILWDSPLPSAAAQLALGADVPVCVVGETVRMRGVGERIDPVAGLPALPVVLINPGVGVSTPAIFNALSNKENPALGTGKPSLEWLQKQRNDLQKPAINMVPEIAETLAALELSGAGMVRMSGSGATCFGVFTTTQAAQTAAASIHKSNPDWWVQATTLNSSNDA